ncbi:MAG: MFS transporter [Flavisolibacter sp.]
MQVTHLKKNQRNSIASEEDRLYAKVTTHLIPFLFICYISNYLDRVNVSIAKLQMQKDLHFSETIFGLGMGVFFIGYILFEVPSNIIMHRVGASKWIARIIITWGLVSASMLFVKTPFAFYTLRFLLGVAEAGFFPGIILYLTYWFPTYRRCRMIGLFFTAIPVAGIIGNPLSGWILNSINGTYGLLGWQWLFLIEAIPSLILGVIAFLYLDDSITKAKWLSIAEKSILHTNLDLEFRTKSEISLRGVLTNFKVWYLALVYFIFDLGLYTLSFWTPTIIKSSGIDNTFLVGLLVAIPNLLAAICMILVSRNSDKSKERRWHLAISSFMGAIGIIISAVFFDNTFLSIIGLSIAYMGIFSCLPVFWSLPTSFLSGAAAAAGIALINAFANASGFLSNYFIGWMKDATGSTSGILFILGGFLVAASILVLSNKQLITKIN